MVIVPALVIAVLISQGPVRAAYGDLIFWIYDQQRAFHKMMTGSLSALADNIGVSTTLTVVSGSFLYGVFHAAGPGHGKVVLSTYLVTRPERIPRSVMMAVSAAFLQGAVAITLVYGLYFLFGMVGRDTRVVVLWSERLSYLLIISLGAWLLWRALSGLANLRRRKQAHAGESLSTAQAHDHDHDHEHTYHQGHDSCSQCGHAHLPTNEQLSAASDMRTILAVIFSIGIRPCSGSVLVLIFAKFAGIPLAGILSVAAISLGTAITVAGLALFTVQMRKMALKTVGSRFDQLSYASHFITCAAGAFLVLVGYGLFVGSYSAPVRSLGV